MINTIDRPKLVRPNSGTLLEMAEDEMGIYFGSSAFCFQMPYPQVSASAVCGFSDTRTPTGEVGVYPGGYSLGAEMLPSQVRISAVSSDAGFVLEHSLGTMPEFDILSRMHFRFFMYAIESSATVLVDDQSEGAQVWSPDDTEFDVEYQRVIYDLRNGGRELAVEELIAILRNSQEDPEEPEVKLFSLQSMARFLVLHSEFADPIIGPDPSGIMQIEWHIDGNGLLVMAFLEDDEIHFIAQADETSSRQAVNESVLVSVNQVVEDYGYLVPFRYA